MKESTTTLAKIFYAIAALALIFAVVCFVMAPNNTSGSTEREITYNGDAYTGMQNAAAQAATNTYYINQNIAALISCVTNIAGLAFLVTSATFAGIAYAKMKEVAPALANQNSDAAQEPQQVAESEAAA